MTQQEVLFSLISWAENHNPEDLKTYRSSDDRKAAALELLKCRVSVEPSYLYTLPSDLIRKLGYQVQQVSVDTFPELTGLAKAGSLVTIIRRIE